jgi:Cu(I)/Ag(I) efflux system membrane fusion protein/cobalt-zinc-cadmium efflux system membrane fusion protein
MTSRTARQVIVGGLLVAGATTVAFAWRGRAVATIPAVAETASGNAAPGALAVDMRRRQLGGVTVARVTRGTLSAEVRAPAVVAYDETTLVDVNLKVAGWIRDLYVTHVGQSVRRDDSLFTLYSPELITAQTQFVTSLNSRDQMVSRPANSPEYLERLIDSPRIRLVRWDVPEDQLRQVEKTREIIDAMVFRSPASGVVIEKMAVAGRHVEPGETLYRLANLSTVWVEAALSEKDLARVKVGSEASVALDASPDRRYPGRVVHMFPYVAEATRTVKARIAVDNRGGTLRPGMLATVRISPPEAEGLVVPADAVVDSGDRQIVFVTERDGYFEARQVSVGARSEGFVLIREGLREGESIAKSGTFLLDSESQIRAAIDNYGRPGAAAPLADGGSSLKLTLRTSPDPPRAGENEFEVQVVDGGGAPVDDAEVRVQLSMPAMPSMNMPAMRAQVTLEHQKGGVFRGSGTVSMAGRWDVLVTADRNRRPLGSTRGVLIVR